MFQKICQLVKVQKYIFSTSRKTNIDHIPTLKEFMKTQNQQEADNIDIEPQHIPYISDLNINRGKKFFIETYGCQMNESDSEIINGILQNKGYLYTKQQDEADIIFLNTCSIREGAEAKIWARLNEIRAQKRKQNKQLITGVLGCMAERLKSQLVEKNKVVDIIVGPDSYKDLPRLIESLTPNSNSYSINVQLSLDETYADVTPIRQNPESGQAYVSIMRGCNNMCSFCIVPYTRGRERSRSLESIVKEVEHLRDQGVKQITLLGQNVNSYHDKTSEEYEEQHQNPDGFKELFKIRQGKGARFSNLLEEVAKAAPEVRFRFTSPHPKDFPDRVLDIIAKYPNIARNIHLPAQSGNSQILQSMRRNYTKESYLQLVDNIKKRIPGITLSSDFICGFCGETEEQFNDTLDLIQKVKYENAFLFAYSMREKTHAHRNYQDDVPENVKKDRLQRMINQFKKYQEEVIKNEINRYHLVLIEGPGKQSNQLIGRTDTNRRSILNFTKAYKFNKDLNTKQNLLQIPLCEQEQSIINSDMLEDINIGDFVIVKVHDVSVKSLFCKPIIKSTISQFALLSNNNPFIE